MPSTHLAQPLPSPGSRHASAERAAARSSPGAGSGTNAKPSTSACRSARRCSRHPAVRGSSPRGPTANPSEPLGLLGLSALAPRRGGVRVGSPRRCAARRGAVPAHGRVDTSRHSTRVHSNRRKACEQPAIGAQQKCNRAARRTFPATNATESEATCRRESYERTHRHRRGCSIGINRMGAPHCVRELDPGRRRRFTFPASGLAQAVLDPFTGEITLPLANQP
jgi:hypothetical protein